jgi:membrane protein required for colicin V production
MNTADLVLLVVLGGFILSGFWFGIIHMIGSLVGLVVGAWAAGHYFDALARFVAPWMGGNINLARIIAFFFIFVLVNRLFGIIVFLAEKVFKIIAIIPFLKTFNRLLGAAFGLIEGTLVLGLAVFFASRYTFTAAFAATLHGSQLAKSLNTVGAILAPLLPQAVRAIQSAI